MSWAPIVRLRKLWNGRFMQALARLERERHMRSKCGGCGRPFQDHPSDFDECVRKVLALD